MGFILRLCIAFVSLSTLCSAFSILDRTTRSTRSSALLSTKEALLDALDTLSGLNEATKSRTMLVNELIEENPTSRPGSEQGFKKYAPGTWKIVYAPHIYTMGRLAGGKFDPVIYDLRADGTMVSHARYSFPIIGSGWLSVSGTFGSQDDDRVCRVNFDKAWVRYNTEKPYPTLESVPDSPIKTFIQSLGVLFFIPQVSVFPVSYLDNDIIVFDFELLGTRICARKVGPANF